jgi:hypothetical protein
MTFIFIFSESSDLVPFILSFHFFTSSTSLLIGLSTANFHNKNKDDVVIAKTNHHIKAILRSSL